MADGKPLAIFFHSQSGRSQQLAFSFYQGAQAANEIPVVLHRAIDSGVGELLNARAWVFIGPENFAAISGGMKAFLDRSYYAFERADSGRGMPYMLITSSGNDGSQCVQKMRTILNGMGAKQVQEAMIIHGEPTEQDLRNMYDLGEGFASAVAMGAF